MTSLVMSSSNRCVSASECVDGSTWLAGWTLREEEEEEVEVEEEEGELEEGDMGL